MTSLDAQARDILRRNDRGGYTVPTAGLYPYQWNWDSVFAAWGFATFDLPRAWQEIETSKGLYFLFNRLTRLSIIVGVLAGLGALHRPNEVTAR